MKNHYILTAILFTSFFVNKTQAQMVVSNTLTPTQLVQYNFIWGGLLANNATTMSPANCIGSFSNGDATNLGMDNGIIMSTGGIALVPNTNTYFLSNSLGGAGDPQCEALSGGFFSYDAVVLEFDFIPFSTPLNFTYVFGSEEYPEYVCSNYNDVFGFFVSGQDPAGGSYTNKDVAIIPGTTLPVMINSVNPGTIGSYGSSGGCTSLAYNMYYVTNTGSTICFDGFTTPLLASFDVVPFTQYHIKLAVSDIGDGIYDSGVFLQANSFFTNSVKIEAYNAPNGTGGKAVEGCATGTFKFSRHDPVAINDTVHFTIDGTAINGTDYNLIPSYVVIPAGMDSACLIIHPIGDGITEEIETVLLHVQVSPYGTQDISIDISDEDNPTAGFNYSDNGQGQITFSDQSLNSSSWYWDFGNGYTSTEQNPVYTYPSPGNYNVMQIVQNDCDSDTAYQTVSIISGISKNNASKEITIYPNPNNGEFVVNNLTNGKDELLIQLINSSGMVVYSKNTSLKITPVNVKNLSKGLYQLKISYGNKAKVERMMIE